MSEFYDDVLYGHDRTERIVAVSPVTDGGDDGSYVTVFYRDGHNLRTEEKREYPFIYVNDLRLFGGLDRKQFKVIKLQGSGYFQFLAAFPTVNAMFGALKQVKRNRAQSGIDGDYYVVYDPVQRYLMQSGRTLFLGLDYDDLVRLQIDIEAYSPNGFPNATRASNVAYIVSMTSNRGFKKVLHIGAADLYTEEELAGEYAHIEHCADEESMLLRLTEIVHEINPDCIEGHNIYGFDLPYLQKRMARYGQDMTWGRDGSEPDVYEGARIKFAERDIEYPKYTFNGRHVVDTMFMVMAYDVTKRKMDGYGLKPAAKHFGFASETRTYVAGDKLSETWLSDPRRIIDYALDDAIECGAISGHLGGSVFYTTQMVPLSYQETGISGTGKKLESLMVREYLRQKYALPQADKRTRQDVVGPNYEFPIVKGKTTGGSQQEVGGYTDIFYTGRYRNIIYADVESLYPSIMLSFGIQPMGDDLNVFTNNLRLLKDLRFRTKDAMRALEGPDGKPLPGKEKDHSRLDNMQSAYKIIINSAYGGLGFKFALFNDYLEADRVTVIGQLIAKKMRRLVERDGGKVIEVDTDGLLAVPPPFVYNEGALTEATEAHGVGRPCEFTVDGIVYRYDGSEVTTDGVDRPMMGDRAYVESLTAEMYEGIVIGFDGRAETMMSMKRKNYALKDWGADSVKLKGGSLKNRTIQPFRRSFMRDIVDGIIANDARSIHESYKKWWLKIVSHDWTPDDFAVTATVKDTIQVYNEKVALGHGNGGRHRAAVYELAISRAAATGVSVKQGDRISFYVAYPEDDPDKAKSNVRVYEDAKLRNEWSQEAPDENTKWYLAKLTETAKLFRMFFKPAEWKQIFHEVSDPDVDYDAIDIRNREVERKPMRVIIAGSRGVDDIWWVERAVAGAKFLREIGGDVYLKGKEIGEVVSGTARGADKLGEVWAAKEGIPVHRMPADWDTHGKAAGMIRNREMAEYAHEDGNGALIAIWDGESRGTKGMIELAEKMGLKVHVSLVDPERLDRYRGTPLPQ